jgi:diacylglycerol kinase (ATP)
LFTLIINPIAGRARRDGNGRRAELARTALASCGEAVSIAVSERRGHVRELTREALRAGSRFVMVWGGDGTVNEAGSVLVGTAVPLAIIPAGSGNGLARELGVPLQPGAAIAAALRAAPRPIDAGELNGRPFFNIAGVGFDAHIASLFDRARRRGLGTYVRVSARELLTYRSRTYRIDCGCGPGDPERVALQKGAAPQEGAGRPILSGSGSAAFSQKALLVTIANSRQFGNGARIAPFARIDDGRLDLVMFEETSRFATVCALPRLFMGGIERVRGMTMRQIDHARIESDVAMAVHVDGEPADGGRSLEIRVLPKALNVIASNPSNS